MSTMQRRFTRRAGLAAQRGMPRKQENEPQFGATPGLTPMSDLDLMISQGYETTPQNLIPADWRTRKKGQPKI